jgi:hypothetical protein
MDRIAIRIALCLLPVSLGAQWINFRTPGIPRTPDGKPNLTASAPRTPDGKPDLSGLWRPEANPYRFDLIQNLKDEDIFRPEAKTIFMQRVADFRRSDPVTHCLPAGPAVVSIEYKEQWRSQACIQIQGNQQRLSNPPLNGVEMEGKKGNVKPALLRIDIGLLITNLFRSTLPLSMHWNYAAVVGRSLASGSWKRALARKSLCIDGEVGKLRAFRPPTNLWQR